MVRCTEVYLLLSENVFILIKKKFLLYSCLQQITNLKNLQQIGNPGLRLRFNGSNVDRQLVRT